MHGTCVTTCQITWQIFTTSDKRLGQYWKQGNVFFELNIFWICKLHHRLICSGLRLFWTLARDHTHHKCLRIMNTKRLGSTLPHRLRLFGISNHKREKCLWIFQIYKIASEIKFKVALQMEVGRGCRGGEVVVASRRHPHKHPAAPQDF